MQTSSIMLDSNLGKILTADNVDKSLQTNTDAKDTTVAKPLMSEEQQSTSLSSEAEVRLVFRFSVEEHLIYRGKIERVQQLQNEELSRLVSRVAWDGAKEGDNNDPDKKDKTTQIDDTNFDLKEQYQEHNQRSLSTQTNETSFTTELTQSNLSSTNLTNHKELSSRTTSIERSNNQSSYPEANLKIQNNPTDKTSEDCSFAQIVRTQNSSLNLSIDCDNSEKLSNHILNETTKNPSQELIPSTKVEKQQNSTKQDNNNKIIDCDNEPETIILSMRDTKYQETVDDDLVDIQSITDALKECLDSVDFEINHKSNESKTPISHHTSHDHFDKTPPMKSDCHISNSPIKETLSDREVAKNDPNEIESKKHDNCVINKTTGIDIASDHRHAVFASYNNKQNDQIEKDTTKLASSNTTYQNKKETPKTIETPMSHKKRKLDQNNLSSSKRIRKGTPKDQRNSTTRKTTAERPISNQNEPNNVKTSTTTTNNNPKNYSSLEESGQKRVRHTNKVFAKWTDNHYYPGTILRQAKDRKYVIGFLDGAQRNVAEVDLIPLSNTEGRQVRVSIAKNYCVNALVHGIENDQPSAMFDVEYQQDGLIRKCVPFKDIFLTGDQGSLLIDQVDRNSGGSNFADVDLNNILFNKRSSRLQDMDDYELADNSSTSSKKKRGKSQRNPNSKINSTSPESEAISSPASSIQSKRNSTQGDNVTDTDSPKPNSNPPSESSSSSNVTELGQDFYFNSDRTKTSLLL